MNYQPVKTLLSKGDTNAKTIKNSLKTYIMYMAPHKLVDGFNLCPYASPACAKACLNSAGRGTFSNVQLARINKSKYWAYDREKFYIQLTNELLTIAHKAAKTGEKIAIRLNGTSDVPHLELIERYTGINFLSDTYNHLYFYDYTKNPNQAEKYLNSNYKITFSRSECNEADALRLLKLGVNVAVVFNELPTYWHGYKVINGDETDLRYFDPSGVVVGLKAKGKAKKDVLGFVIK